MTIVDVDDADTWTRPLSEVVDRWASIHAKTTEYTSDLALPLEEEGPFRRLLAGHLLRAYHLTRLLPHEVRVIRKTGLRPLTRELVTERIEAARSEGAISQPEADSLHRAHVFAVAEDSNRRDQVCLALSKQVMHTRAHGCVPLLSIWGGECIYMSSGQTPSLERRLKTLGKPSIVSALLGFGGADDARHRVFPALHKVFVGARLGLEDVGADVFYRAPVAPERIEAIWQPGSRHYDQFSDLPRS